jgi:hypothetical protein
VTGDEAKFELLKIEMQSIQQGIRGIDGILFQIKGWCVTVTVAIAGFSLTGDRWPLIVFGMAAVLAFWMVDAHYKSVQRIYIDRDQAIEKVLGKHGPLEALRTGSLKVPGLASEFSRSGFKDEMRYLWKEVRNPITFGLYVLILLMLGVYLLITLTLGLT